MDYFFFGSILEFSVRAKKMGIVTECARPSPSGACLQGVSTRYQVDKAKVFLTSIEHLPMMAFPASLDFDVIH